MITEAKRLWTRRFLTAALIMIASPTIAEVDAATMDNAAKAQGAEQFNFDTLTWCKQQGVDIDVEGIMTGWLKRNRAVLDAAEEIVIEGESQYPNARQVIRDNAKKHSDQAIAAVAQMNRERVVGFCLDHARKVDGGVMDLTQDKFRALIR